MSERYFAIKLVNESWFKMKGKEVPEDLEVVPLEIHNDLINQAKYAAYRDAKAIVTTQDKRNAIEWLDHRLKVLKGDKK